MPTNVLPELAASGARTLRRILDHRAGLPLPDPDLKGLLRQARLNLDFITESRDSTATAFLASGVEGTGLRRDCAALADALDIFLSSIPDLRALAAQQPAGAGRDDSLRELASLEARGLDLRRSFEEWLGVLRRTPAALDGERLRRGQFEAAAGQGEDVADLLARMTSGD